MKWHLRMAGQNEILAPVSESRAQFLVIAIKNVGEERKGERERGFCQKRVAGRDIEYFVWNGISPGRRPSFRRRLTFSQVYNISKAGPAFSLSLSLSPRSLTREQQAEFHWGCPFDLQWSFIERRDAIGESQSYSISSRLREICNYTDYEDAPCQGIFNHVVIFWFSVVWKTPCFFHSFRFTFESFPQTGLTIFTLHRATYVDVDTIQVESLSVCSVCGIFI